MAFLSRQKKADLLVLAYEMSIDTSDSDRIVDLVKKITLSLDYSEEFVKGILQRLVEEREEQAATEKDRIAAELEEKRLAAEEKRIAAEEKRVQAELEGKRLDAENERLRLTSSTENVSIASARSENAKYRPDIRKFMPIYESDSNEISLYLTMFERQVRVADIHESEWVSHLLSLLPMDLVQLIMRETEENSQSYEHVKELLLERFKMKPETFRVKFTQHQKKPNALWKELVFELRTFLDSWIDGVGVKTFEELKNLMVCDQIKRRVPAEVREHFIDEWADIIDPKILTDKLDRYEAVRKNQKRPNTIRNIERKDFIKDRHSVDKREDRPKKIDKDENESLWKDSSPNRNWRTREFERPKRVACYHCNSENHLRPQCPLLDKGREGERINHLRVKGQMDSIFAPYMSVARINGREMKILHDSGSSIDVISRSRVKIADYTGESVWVRQPLDDNFRSLPVARIFIESPEFGQVITKAAVKDNLYDQNLYLLGNQTAKLIEKNKLKPIHMMQAVVTRAQARALKRQNASKNSEYSANEEDKPALNSRLLGKDEEGEVEIPEAEQGNKKFLKVPREDLSKKQRSCDIVKDSWNKNREGKRDYVEKKNHIFRKTKDRLASERFHLMNRMKRCQDLTIERMIETREIRKKGYDRNAILWRFKPGDQVSIIATSKSNKLADEWVGPGIVESQLSETDYIVRRTDRNDRARIYNVNMLKPYHRRPESINFFGKRGRRNMGSGICFGHSVSGCESKRFRFQ